MEQWAELFRGGRLVSLLTLCLGVWLHAADSLLVATIMPSVVREMGGAEWVAWALTLYLLGTIAAGAITGALVSRVGVAACMVGGALVYTAGCAVSALAGDMGVLLLGRTAQGFGGGGMVAVAHVAVCGLFPAAQWPRLFALLSAVWGTSALCGPLVGGLFAEAGLWRGAFWAFGAQALLLAALAVGVLRGVQRVAGDPSLSARSFVVLMAAVLAIGVAGNVRCTTAAILLMGLGAALLVAFLRADARAASPVLPRPAAGTAGRLGAGLAMVLLLGSSTMSFAVYGPLLMERLYGAGPLLGGYMVASESLAWTAAALLFAGVRSARGEAWLIRGGAWLTVLGTVLFAVLMPLGPLWLLLAGAIAQGAGLGMAWGFIARRVVEASAATDKARAAAAVPTTQEFGYALGAALSGVVANAAGFADGVSVAASLSVGFWVFYAFLPLGLLGIAAAWRLGAAR